MRRLVILVCTLLALINSTASASSFVNIWGEWTTPIRTVTGQVHPYAGVDLQPSLGGSQLNLMGVNLQGADLNAVDLRYANLIGANLSDANLVGADLRFADLRGANLGNANLYSATLRHTDVRGANLSNTNLIGSDLAALTFLGTTLGSALYSPGTNLDDTFFDGGGVPFDPTAAGWIPTPEPSTGLLLAIGLLGLSARTTRQRRSA